MSSGSSKKASKVTILAPMVARGATEAAKTAPRDHQEPREEVHRRPVRPQNDAKGFQRSTPRLEKPFQNHHPSVKEQKNTDVQKTSKTLWFFTILRCLKPPGRHKKAPKVTILTPKGARRIPKAAETAPGGSLQKKANGLQKKARGVQQRPVLLIGPTTHPKALELGTWIYVDICTCSQEVHSARPLLYILAANNLFVQTSIF